jgi:hypothetical protein
MATRSYIAIENKDGSVRSIYCHWDGYPEGVGQKLKDHYKTRSDVEELIDLGNISSLDSNIYKTEAYVRDRGEDEKDNAPKIHSGLGAFEMYFKKGTADYAYVFTKDNEWSWYGYGITRY